MIPRTVREFVQVRQRPVKRLLALGIGCGLAVAAGLGCKLALWTWAARVAEEELGPQPGGTLLICGGGPLPDEIRQRFCQLAGGAKAQIVIIPAHHAEPGSVSARQYLDAWGATAVGSVELLSIERRKFADDPEFVAPLKRATGVWLGGGDQNWLTMIYRDTETSRQLQAVLDRGGVIGGSSAGAAAMTRVMIASGRSEAIEAEGLGLWPAAIIDQHFLRRNRLQRFVKTLEAHPELVGFGVDEQTALEVQLRSGRLTVIGKSYVLACVPANGAMPQRFEVLKQGDRTTLADLRDFDVPVVSPVDFEELAASQ